jgi:hypothetical protein
MRKKFIFWLCLPAFVGILLIAAFGCTKKGSTPENPIAQVPEVITTDVSKINIFTAESGGNCSDGGAPVTAKGVCWSTSHNPTTDSPKTNDSSGAGSYKSNISGLTPNTTYYLRAYATNRLGTGYGSEVNFTTASISTILSTDSVTAITSKTAQSGGKVSGDGGCQITAKGVCWNTSPNPTIQNYKTVDSSGTGSYISNLTGLTANTSYYVRAYITNSVGTFYGNEVGFTSGQFYIGQNYEGGIIFYIDVTGHHGLIAAASDQGYAQWGCIGTLIGATDTAVGTGQSNTSKIVNACSQTGTAAKICDDLVLNGYSDWFLPSAGELYLMSCHQDVLGGTGEYYWSSTEYSSQDAVMYNFYITGMKIILDKNQGLQTRAIRAF